MIKKFNFFDIYGYFIPGTVFLVLLWFPFGLTMEADDFKQFIESISVASAALFIVLAYVSGHLLWSIGSAAFPLAFPDKNGRRRFPSERMLEDDTFPDPVRQKLCDAIHNQFGLKVSVSKTGQNSTAEKNLRFNAFMLCRDTLIQQKKASYPEQFEGMYAMMCGLLTAFLLAAFSQLAWVLAALSPLLPNAADWLLGVLLGITLILLALRCFLWKHPKRTTHEKQVDRRWIWIVAALIFALNLASASCMSLDAIGELGCLKSAGPFVTGFVVLLFLAHRCYVAYEKFAILFAASVYRNFLVL